MMDETGSHRDRRAGVLRVALRCVPERWRDSVTEDLHEEAERRGLSGRALEAWLVLHALGIGARLRLEPFIPRAPTEGVLTGFLRHDVVAAFRHLRRTRAASAVIVLTIAAAVAGVTVVGSVLVHSVLAPLAFPRADRLVAVYQVNPASPDAWFAVAPGNTADLLKEASTFERVAAARNVSFTFTGFDDGDTPLMRLVSHGWFETLGITPVIGRTFTAEEDRPNGPRVAILSHAAWQQRFGGSVDIVGRTVELDFVPYTIVGVVPEHDESTFMGLVDEPQVWMPLQLPASGGDRSFSNHFIAGLLRAGVSMVRAQAELTRLGEGLAVAYPDTNREVRLLVTPLDESIVRPVRTPVLFMFGVVLVVFVAACGNVSTLMLARSWSRRQDVAIQRALGAPRFRVALQVLVEHLAIAMIAGTLAVGAALVIGRSVVWLVPEGFLAPRFAFSMDGWTLALAGGAAVLAGLVASVPSLLAVGARAESDLKASGARTTDVRRLWFSSLIAVEVMGAVILLVAAGLVAAGFDRLRSADAGFEADRALTFRVSTRGPLYADGARRFEFFERVSEAFGGIPGVVSVGATSVLPVFPQFSGLGAYAADEPRPDRGREPMVALARVTPGFFEALRIPLVSGRLIRDDDRAGTARVVVLSRSAARAVFGTSDPLHRRVTFQTTPHGDTAEVIGVVGDVRSAVDPTAYTAFVYQPWSQASAPNAIGFVVRTAGAPEASLPLLRAALREVDRQMPLYQPRTLAEIERQIDARGRFAATLLAAFAGLGLVLVASGIYGTLSHMAWARQREMGLRMALGASRSVVLLLVLREAFRPAAAGALVGLLVALAVGRVASSAVSGTPAFSMPIFVGLPAFVILVVALSSLLPARRATRVDPVIALKAE